MTDPSPPPPAARRKIFVALGAAVVVAAVAAAGIFWWVAVDPNPADPKDAKLVALGQRVYAAECAACHGVGLEGQPNWQTRDASGRLPAPPHDASGHTWHHPDQVLFEITKHGVQRFAPPGYLSDMPNYEDTLSDREIWAVIAYIKSAWSAEIRARQAEMDKRYRATN